MHEIPLAVRRAIVEIEISDLNVSEFCREHGVSRDRFYQLRRRYLAEGKAGISPRSRAPKHVTNRVSAAIEDLIVSERKRLTDAGLDAGAHTIGWHMEQAGIAAPSPATIWRILSRRGFVTPDPSKRPTKPLKRFAAERVNECWQIDATHWTLTDGRIVEIVNIIDDCSRLCIRSHVAEAATTSTDAWNAFCGGAGQKGLPARILSDNGTAFTGGVFAANLTLMGIHPGHSSPYHPQTCGKVERFHQTLKQWLSAQPPAETITDLQQLLDRFTIIYNTQRPHRSLGRRTPADVYHTTPKSGPDPTAITNPTTVHHNTVDKNGRVEIPGPYTIAIGNTWTGQIVTTIRTGSQAHLFINGLPVRQLTLNLTRRNQPLHPKPGRPTTK